MRLLRAPLLHFLLGGAALFRLVHGPAPLAAVARDSRATPVAVMREDVTRLRAEYAQETGLEPTDDDEAALIDRAIDEELLLREALARGLDRNDRSVRTWLIQQMGVLSETRDGDPEALYRQARELGLDRSDVVVRRMLTQKMRLLVGRVGDSAPGDETLRAYYAEHRDDYAPPARVSLWQVFFSSTRGADAERAAREALAALRAEGARFTAVRAGDPFAVPAHLIGQSPAQLAKLFGPEFAAELARADTGGWLGPFPSAHGFHLVWIEAREAGVPPDFDEVRTRVLERWQDEQRTERVAQLLRELRGRYSLRVESSAWQLRRAS